jgi:hypothetical protein
MQRKGQFIYNMLRPEDKPIKDDVDMLRYKANIADSLWNMTDIEFDKIQVQYRQFHGMTPLQSSERVTE